jgi:hypothetical protein
VVRSSESVGEVQINRFGGDRVGRVLKTKIKLSILQINFFLRPMISVSQILSLQPRTTPSKEAPMGGVSRFLKPCRRSGKWLTMLGVCFWIFDEAWLISGMSSMLTYSYVKNE